jgi:hypothetical protein
MYAVLVWGQTYKSNLHPLLILQKKAMRIMTFSGFREHTFPLFKALKLLKFLDLVYVNTATFMFQYSLGNLPADSCGFFTLINIIKITMFFKLKITMFFKNIKKIHFGQ